MKAILWGLLIAGLGWLVAIGLLGLAGVPADLWPLFLGGLAVTGPSSLLLTAEATMPERPRDLPAHNPSTCLMCRTPGSRAALMSPSLHKPTSSGLSAPTHGAAPPPFESSTVKAEVGRTQSEAARTTGFIRSTPFTPPTGGTSTRTGCCRSGTCSGHGKSGQSEGGHRGPVTEWFDGVLWDGIERAVPCWCAGGRTSYAPHFCD